MSNSWFKKTSYIQVEIKIFDPANSKQPRLFIVKSADFIEMLVRKISKVPAVGEMFISFAPTVVLTEFHFTSDDGQVEIIEMYASNLKTPHTSFNMNQSEEENFVAAIAEGLHSPKIGKNVPAIENVENKFPEFSVTKTN